MYLLLLCYTWNIKEHKTGWFIIRICCGRVQRHVYKWTVASLTYAHSHKCIGLVHIAGIVIYRNKILLYLHFIDTILFPIINNLLTHSLLIITLPLLILSLTQGASLSWSYGSWIYNYLCNQCLSPLTLWVWIPLMAMCNRYNIMW